jgi:hypothetical protein
MRTANNDIISTVGPKRTKDVHVENLQNLVLKSISRLDIRSGTTPTVGDVCRFMIHYAHVGFLHVPIKIGT